MSILKVRHYKIFPTKTSLGLIHENLAQRIFPHLQYNVHMPHYWLKHPQFMLSTKLPLVLSIYGPSILTMLLLICSSTLPELIL